MAQHVWVLVGYYVPTEESDELSGGGGLDTFQVFVAEEQAKQAGDLYMESRQLEYDTEIHGAAPSVEYETARRQDGSRIHQWEFPDYYSTVYCTVERREVIDNEAPMHNYDADPTGGDVDMLDGS